MNMYSPQAELIIIEMHGDDSIHFVVSFQHYKVYHSNTTSCIIPTLQVVAFQNYKLYHFNIKRRYHFNTTFWHVKLTLKHLKHCLSAQQNIIKAVN